jgi:hypothetical protein
MDRILRVGLIGIGILMLISAAGYFWQLPWAIGTWPWGDGRLSYTFIAAMLAAIAAALIWIGVSQEWGAMAAGALNLIVMMGGLTFVFTRLALQGRTELWTYAIGAAVSVLINLYIFYWSHRLPLRDNRPTPRPVLVAFGVFAAVLLLVGVALLLRVAIIFPWELNPDSASVFAWLFIGDAFYFLYAIWRPKWHYACAPLWSFLAYDLVLLTRFLPHFGTVKPELMLSLIVYTAVLIFSGALAIYYLLINRETRSLAVAGS